MSAHYYVDRGFTYGPVRRVRLGVVRRRSRHEPLPRVTEPPSFPLAA